MKRPTPEEFEKTFERISKSAPVENQNDPDFKKTTLMFLALGGETLARHHIETYLKPFPEKLTLFDKTLEDEALKEGTEEQSDESEETEETD
ncbi:MAG: hypothetical protein P1P89_10595 [Desulfobacterales bacterium]|nr:hypothetical protein [Desulfobacterales bacterium]